MGPKEIDEGKSRHFTVVNPTVNVARGRQPGSAAWRGLRWPPACTACVADAVTEALLDRGGQAVILGREGH